MIRIRKAAANIDICKKTPIPIGFPVLGVRISGKNPATTAKTTPRTKMIADHAAVLGNSLCSIGFGGSTNPSLSRWRYSGSLSNSFP